MKDNKRKFTWNDNEISNHDSAYERMNEIAEEYEIETFFSGGEQFADRIDNEGMKYSDFTVEEYAKWKARVVDLVMSALVESERLAFAELLAEKKKKK